MKRGLAAIFGQETKHSSLPAVLYLKIFFSFFFFVEL